MAQFLGVSLRFLYTGNVRSIAKSNLDMRLSKGYLFPDELLRALQAQRDRVMHIVDSFDVFSLQCWFVELREKPSSFL